MISPQSDFGALLTEAFRDCLDKPARVLDETLRERVGEFVRLQEEALYGLPGFPNNLRADAQDAPSQERQS